MLPALIGPLPATQKTIEARLCGGGIVEIPIGPLEKEPAAPCQQKGCHAGCNRKRIDPAQ
ncbi:MAG TPA: hypothetical protein DEP68_07485 [Erythrobacter sp.]|nr:hypothetical protein [Sphingomonadaceae bacterium]MAQ65630.1 hypothetical protein [Sphingomonadaceae bacterium]MBG74786.1 hypothetical protein [Erythrobacteraceae bacterium]HAA93370.1 hypothetical protein [Rhodospirillaceae bacterium]HCB78605.1 hypothetical protein [Erythrobacter sp.]